jgi:porin
MEYYFMQGLSKKLAAIVGRVNATNFLDRNRYADNPRNQFMNLSMNNSPLLGSMISFSTYGVLAAWKITDNITINPAIYDPNLQPGEGSPEGKDLFSDVGLAAEIDVNWKLSNDRDGVFRIAGLWDNKDTVLLDNPRLPVDIPLGIDPETKSDNWLVNVNFEQEIWRPSGAKGKPARTHAVSRLRTAAFDFQEPGIGAFARVAYGPEDRHAWNFYAMGGLSGRGFFPSRPYDRVGLGFYWLKEGDDLDDQPGNLFQDETGIEAFYNLALTPAVQLTFDAQWINSGIKANDDPVVLGVRLMTAF